MARARWLMMAVLALGGCTEQRLELEQEKAKNRALEEQVQMLNLQLDQLRKQLDERKAAPAPAPAVAPSDGDKTVGGEKALQDAQDAYVHGQYKDAIDLARAGIDASPSRAWRVIGASQCFLKNKASAHEAWTHLDAQGKQFLKYVCSRSGVAL